MPFLPICDLQPGEKQGGGMKELGEDPKYMVGGTFNRRRDF